MMSFFPAGASTGGLQPYQFRPETYGALGDGKVISDGVVNGTTTFTSATAGFTSGDTGKTIMINGGNGTTVAPLIAKITFVSSTTVTLSVAAGVSASGCAAVYGTDDTAAFNSAVSAASTFAQANQFYAQIVLGAKIYCLASGPTQTGNGSSTPTFNSQITLPFPNANGTTRKLVIEFTGPADASQCQYFQSTIPNLMGAVLVSMVLAPASGGLAPFGAQSVIGGPTGSFGFTGGFANMKPVLTRVMIVTGALSQQIGADFRFCGGAGVDRSSFQAFASVLGNSPTIASLTTNATFTGGNSIGLYMPTVTNNDDCNASWVAVEGFTFGIAANEHFSAQRLAIIYANIGLFVNPSGAPTHGWNLGYVSVEASNIALQAAPTASAQFPVTIGLMDNEAIATRDIDDAANALAGRIEWAAFDQTTPRVNGGSVLKVLNHRLGPGHMASPPVVPASTSSAVLVFRDAFVVIHTGVGVTVSAVTIDGTATGLTMAASSSLAVRVASGKTIAMTYAGGTPTWDWWLD